MGYLPAGELELIVDEARPGHHSMTALTSWPWHRTLRASVRTGVRRLV